MNLFFRLVGSVVGAGLILAAIPLWLVNDPDMGTSSMARESERGRELDRALYRSQQRIAALEGLLQELLAGNTSLSEALRESRALYSDDGAIVQHIHRSFGGQSSDEALCRHLLFRVSVRRSPRQYSQSSQVLSRLEAEFKQLYPLTKQPVVDRSPLSMEPCREGCSGPSSYDPVDPGL